MQNDLTIIIPAHNEESGLKKILPKMIANCEKISWKIVVINDASTDGTANVLKQYEGKIRVLENKSNMGYGASIKRGVRAAQSEWVATFDGDGQHRLEDLLEMARDENAAGFDAVIGQRTKDGHSTKIRKPGKLLLTMIVNVLVGRKIKDINCGLRMFRRRALFQIMRLTSNRFSFSVSSLVAMINMGYNINLYPVRLEKRLGKSSVRQIRDGLTTIIMVMQLIMLFNPLRIILPISMGVFAVCGFLQCISFILFGWDINDATVLLFLVGLLMLVLALIADQISALRRETSYCEIIDENTCREE